MRADPYEDYSQQVTRQLDLHYRPFSQRDVPIAWQPINDFVRAIIYKGLPMGLWVEIGCGVGSLIGDLAAKYPKQQCYGFDYSYQMLRVAQDYWRATKPVEWLSMRGFGYCSVSARPSISNVAFALAQADELPLPPASAAFIMSSFLLDRLPVPDKAIAEWSRIQAPGGRLAIISPFNFQQARHWQQYFPPNKIVAVLQKHGYFEVSVTQLVVEETLDLAGSSIRWQCRAIQATKES